MDRETNAGTFSESDTEYLNQWSKWARQQAEKEKKEIFGDLLPVDYSQRKNWNTQPPALQQPAQERYDTITGSELQKLELPPVEFLVDEILPLGLALLGAPPKSCKSYMCLQMCLAICTGHDFMGFKTKPHACLYLDLESTRRRPKLRLNQILQGMEAPENLYIVTRSGPMGKGFEDELRRTVSEHPEIKLVIVDVFKKIRPSAKRGADPYERDYEDFGAIKALADELQLAILLVTHTTKMKHPDDPFNELVGSAGTMGSVDVAMVIKKDTRDAETAKLYVSGKDLRDQCYEIRYDKQRYIWEKLGTSQEVEAQRLREEYNSDRVIQAIRKLVEQGGGIWEGTASDIVEASRYFRSGQITDDVAKIGKKIRKYTQQLIDFDAIIFTCKVTNRTSEYCFRSKNPFTTSTTSTTTPTSTTSTTIEHD